MTTPDHDRPAGTTDFGEADRNYTDDPARTTDVGESDRDYTDDLTPAGDATDANRPGDLSADRPGDLGADRPGDLGADHPGAVADADRTAGVGEADPAYADEADRSAYANADRLDDSDRTTDVLDTPTETDAAPVGDTLDGQQESAPDVSPDDPLVPADIAVDFKARWDVIQQGFVDDPRVSVTDADKLVSDVLERLSATFDQQHQSLEGQWSNGEPSTEDLRGALQRYRAFFDRLLTL